MTSVPTRAKKLHTGWSPNRDRAAQARFRAALMKRSGGVCEWRPYCKTPTLRLQAHHVVSVSAGGSYDVANGLLLCSRHHRKLQARPRALAKL